MTPQLLAFTLPTNGLQLTALLAICFTVLIGLILVIFALGNVIKKLTLQKGDTKLTVGAVDEPEKLEEIESIDQAGQDLYTISDIFGIVFATAKVYGQIAKEELKLPYSIYDQQKRYVRKQVRQMYEEDIDVYLKLLDKVQKTLDADILEHSNDYKSYLNTAYRVYDRVKDIFVDEILVENHMEEKSRQTGEWDKYIRGVIKNIKSEMNTMLSMYYLTEQIITKAELMKEMENNFIVTLETNLRMMLEECRLISEKQNQRSSEEIKELNENFDALVYQYCGKTIDKNLLR
jgi:hypothetical protein